MCDGRKSFFHGKRLLVEGMKKAFICTLAALKAGRGRVVTYEEGLGEKFFGLLSQVKSFQVFFGGPSIALKTKSFPVTKRKNLINRFDGIMSVLSPAQRMRLRECPFTT